jgi:hypothetical protein
MEATKLTFSPPATGYFYKPHIHSVRVGTCVSGGRIENKRNNLILCEQNKCKGAKTA